MMERQVPGLLGRGHLLGCLAAAEAKRVLLGRKAAALHVRASALLTTPQKDAEVPGLALQADEHQALWGPQPLPSPQTHLPADSARQAAHKTKRGPAAPGRLNSLMGSLHSVKRKHHWWFLRPSSLYVWNLFRSSPTPKVSGSWDWLEVPPAGNSHPGGEEKEGQDSLLEKAAAHEAVEAGWKEHREGNWQIHRGPQDSWISSLSPIKLTIYSSCLAWPALPPSPP